MPLSACLTFQISSSTAAEAVDRLSAAGQLTPLFERLISVDLRSEELLSVECPVKVNSVEKLNL